MAGTAEILQEYLVSIGFQSDAISLRKVESKLTAFEKGLFKVSGAAIAAVSAVEAATADFAYSMRKVYFEAELAGSSVKHLKELEYAGRQIGISADTMGNAVHSMAQAMRLNPGLEALVESFGVKVQGRDVSDVMVDFVRALNSMPEFEAAKFAQMLGIDPDTYHLMRTHMRELLAARKQMADMYRELGLDPDKARAATLHYATSLDNLRSHLLLLSQALMIKFEPAFDSVTAVLIQDVDWWIKWAEGVNHVSDAIKDLIGDLKQLPHKAYESIFPDAGSKTDDRTLARRQEWAKLYGQAPIPPKVLDQYPNLTPYAWARIAHGALNGPQTAPEAGKTAYTGGSDAATLLPALEKKYGLPPGLLGAQWAQESSMGKHVLSPSGAMGPFQFMKKTGNQYGLHGADFYDFGKSAEAAARYDHDLLQKYKTTNRALAAYNWGSGTSTNPRLDAALNHYGDTWLGHAPQETQDYVSNIEGYLNTARLKGVGGGGPVTQNNTTNITVQSPDPSSAGSKVASSQSRVYADYLRNLKSIVQ